MRPFFNPFFPIFNDPFKYPIFMAEFNATTNADII